MDQESIGGYLKSIRKQRGLTLTKLAEVSGVSHPYISQIENNKFTPSPEILRKLADPLGVRFMDLMERAGHAEKIVREALDVSNRLKSHEYTLNFATYLNEQGIDKPELVALSLALNEPLVTGEGSFMDAHLNIEPSTVNMDQYFESLSSIWAMMEFQGNKLKFPNYQPK